MDPIVWPDRLEPSPRLGSIGETRFAALRARADRVGAPSRSRALGASRQEMLEDPEQKIARPKQLYLGYGERPVPAG